MHDQTLDYTLTFDENGVCIIETDCKIEASYKWDSEEGACNVRINAFVFRNWNSDRQGRIEPSHKMFPFLAAIVDMAWVTEKLDEGHVPYIPTDAANRFDADRSAA